MRLKLLKTIRMLNSDFTKTLIDKGVILSLEKNMTITRKGSSFKQTQNISKEIDENELNDMCYAV